MHTLPFHAAPIRAAALGLAFLTLTAAGCSSTDAACTDVAGTVAGQSTPVLDGEAVTGFRVEDAAVDGDMTGIASADFALVGADEDGTLQLTGSHTFVDGAGAFLFRTEDEGLTTAEGHVENHMTLVEGGTGTLDTEGTVDLQTGALSLAYTGRVCR